MGLSHSKPHPRVTKVAPLQNKEEELPSASPVDFAFSQNLEEKSSYLFTGLQDQNKALEGQLPPLRETWYGRYSAGPRAMYFDIPLEHGETSIIKRHPPRRLQDLSLTFGKKGIGTKSHLIHNSPRHLDKSQRSLNPLTCHK
uniref:Coiled-coil domain containing 198 n=1 Tax=Felis catus TaxID=9685 RepID=A0ABI7YDU8_FELCA